MKEYTTIKRIGVFRLISRVVPLKHKLNFLIKRYLVNGRHLAIPFTKHWTICTTVNELNRSTIENLILEGTLSQPEIALVNKLKKRFPDNMRMIDVGGNIGSFYCQFLEKCESVHVFEPIPRLNEVISNSVVYNNDVKTTLVKKAVGNLPGTVQMQDNNNSNVLNSQNESGSINIEITTLDLELNGLDRIDFIKIDVEGYEMHVLEGAVNTVKKYRPSFLVELHPTYLRNYNKDHEAVIDFFIDNNYKVSYFSFLEELRMPRLKRIISRWQGNKGIEFKSREDFSKDILKEPTLSSYHIFCEPA